MKTKLFAALIVAIVLTACSSKQDYGYNEKMASLFLSCMDKVDETYAKLQDGGYNAIKDNDISYEMNLKDAKGKIKYVNQIKGEADSLAHSALADEFHASAIGYMNEIAEGYFPLLVKYVEEQDSTTRQSIYKEITLKKEQLEQMADQSMAVQTKFLNSAGIKINN